MSVSLNVARLTALALLSLLVVGGAADAQAPKPTPAPTAAPTPVAFTAHAHAGATVTTDSGTYSGTIQLGIAQRAQLIRIEVLSIASDSFPLPPLRATAVIDRGANTLLVWSDATRRYHTQAFIPRPAASPTPAAKPTAAPRGPGASPFANLDVFELTLKLIGHAMTMNVPTTGMSFDMQVRKKGEAASSHLTATTQLADEFSVFPMTIDASIEPGATSFSAKLSYAVDDLTRTTPDLARFTVPAGYTEVPSFAGVVFGPRPAKTGV